MIDLPRSAMSSFPTPSRYRKCSGQFIIRIFLNCQNTIFFSLISFDRPSHRYGYEGRSSLSVKEALKKYAITMHAPVHGVDILISGEIFQSLLK